ncbi:hypothetical protein LZ30DRAFT_259124 [Colletotrichum cereale]|nr:hypothetical protein LZ30DRAFT_259124 [Colletotrichum cereale]
MRHLLFILEPPGTHVFIRSLHVEQTSIIFYFLYCNTTKPHDHPSSASHHTSSILRGHHSCASPNDQRDDEEHEAFTHYATTTLHHLGHTKRTVFGRLLSTYSTAYCPPKEREKHTRKREREREESYPDAPELGRGAGSGPNCGRWDDFEFDGWRRKRGVGRRCVKDGVSCIAAKKSSVGRADQNRQRGSNQGGRLIAVRKADFLPFSSHHHYHYLLPISHESYTTTKSYTSSMGY